MGEIQLLVGGAQVGEQIEHFVQGTFGFCVGLINFVQHHNRAQAQSKGLGQNEFGLWHRAFGGVNQQAHAVNHRQDPLHFATKIGVAGGVDDVDADAVMFDTCAFGQNGNAALTLDVVAVHRALRDLLPLAERAGLFQKLVNERGFAMVDVGDNGDVAKLHRGGLFRFSAVARALQGLRLESQRRSK